MKNSVTTYTLPGGQKVKFLDDGKTYLGNQSESEFGETDVSAFLPVWILF